MTATLTDMAGRIVNTQQGGGILQIDTKNIAAGTYILNVSADGSMHSQKIVVAH